ncbi:hypothetical protein [Paucibacter sp. DJ2R-2]|uniref:hypothetical protein n=1 Tax=Paucibacter sp. DJ2R-2 TaxID=2893558 RepID=UPI0021E4077A|nr:hypothetical protein [Paucibacter sp. DJ2R-2]MCV2437503.1 hypothetical protein [Paucibacter sp. DJ2R-2]
MAKLELLRHWALPVRVGLASAYTLAGRHARARPSHLAKSGPGWATALALGLMAVIVAMPIPSASCLRPGR